jgi:mRNA-degrading endonuclease RelE of RelBE toxin-antitoxin system
MAFEVSFTPSANKELKRMRANDRRIVLGAIERRLVDQPHEEARNRKRLDNVTPDFDFEPPLWELRCGDFRVFYDVNESCAAVTIRAVRKKERGQTTGEVLHENHDT